MEGCWCLLSRSALLCLFAAAAIYCLTVRCCLPACPPHPLSACLPVCTCKVETIYRESLLELEMIHKQEELEQLELEQALSMSLLAEEERLKRARLEVKNSPDDDEEQGEAATVKARHQEQAEAKICDSPTLSYARSSKGGDDGAKGGGDHKQQTPSKAKLRPTDVPAEHAYADPKPLKLGGGGLGSPLKALPSISKAQRLENLTEMNKSYNEKKKKTEQAFSRNSRQLNDSKQKQVRG